MQPGRLRCGAARQPRWARSGWAAPHHITAADARRARAGCSRAATAAVPAAAWAQHRAVRLSLQLARPPTCMHTFAKRLVYMCICFAPTSLAHARRLRPAPWGGELTSPRVANPSWPGGPVCPAQTPPGAGQGVAACVPSQRCCRSPVCPARGGGCHCHPPPGAVPPGAAPVPHPDAAVGTDPSLPWCCSLPQPQPYCRSCIALVIATSAPLALP
jgi:hypothetical protein